MQPFQTESATLPRGFRFHYQDGERPKTPEPLDSTNQRPPSPPRATRLKLKRRNVSRFTAPTEHFLASVAAADIPIPTIEVPHLPEDEDMLDLDNTPHLDSELLSPRQFDRGETPRTPIPDFGSEEHDANRPDWYMDTGSNSEDIPTRPSSSLSNPSNWSDDSFYSGGDVSRPSDDGSCTSPESDIADPFRFASLRKGKGIVTRNIDATISSTTTPPPLSLLNGQVWSKTRKGAKWSKDMSEHLWKTYQLYLQDPTVTPFRIGASSIPPEGVVHRVAREAKRSWKGPSSSRLTKPSRSASATLESSMGPVELASPFEPISRSKSGSLTPTDSQPRKAYTQWPHSSSATRNHLRELCRLRDSTSVQTHRHLQSRSPTPFTQQRPRANTSLPTPAHSRYSSFSTKDIALSLTTSCSDSMQPDGPLALLANSEAPALPEVQVPSDDKSHTLGLGISLDTELASSRNLVPITPRTYGPSSSKSFNTFLRPKESAPPRLASPVRFHEARSLNSTQKRRAQHSLDEELSPNGGALRPSILNDQVFGESSESQHRRVRSRGFSLGDDFLKTRIDGLFEPPRSLDEVALGAEVPPLPVGQSATTSNTVTPSLLPAAPIGDLPPLSTHTLEAGSSNTFPRRLFQPLDGTATMKRRPYATMHHPHRSVESADPFIGGDSSLQSKLHQIDQKLAEIRDREAALRSPSNE